MKCSNIDLPGYTLATEWRNNPINMETRYGIFFTDKQIKSIYKFHKFVPVSIYYLDSEWRNMAYRDDKAWLMKLCKHIKPEISE